MPVNYRLSEEIKQAWGEWLTGLCDWEWFVTMTFRDPPPGGTWTKPGWGYAKSAWRGFLAESAPALDGRKWVRCFEMQRERGVPHIHALVSGIDRSVTWRYMKEWCFVKYGIARILPYNPGLGAGYYLCKYLSKELSDIEFGGM